MASRKGVVIGERLPLHYFSIHLHYLCQSNRSRIWNIQHMPCLLSRKKKCSSGDKKKCKNTWTSWTPEDFLVITFFFFKLLNQCFNLAKINIISCVWLGMLNLSPEGIFTTCKQTQIMEIPTNLTIMMLLAFIFEVFSLLPLPLQETNIHCWLKSLSRVFIRESQTFVT